MAKKRTSASRGRKKEVISTENASDGDVPEVSAVDVASSPSPPLSPRTNPTLSTSPQLNAGVSESNLRATAPKSLTQTSNLPVTAPNEAISHHERSVYPTEEDPLLPALLMRTHAIDSAASDATIAPIPRSRSLVLNDNATVLQAMPTSKVEVVEVMAEQSWLITKLTVQLLWALRMSQKWILMAFRLITFVVLLLPGLLRMVAYWALDSHVHKHLIYGLNGRNLLDVYTVPSDKIIKPTKQQLDNKLTRSLSDDGTDVASLKRPVVVFISGGAWIIGYKGWGALMGKALASFGIVVVMPDYRNFPQGILPNMVDDATMAMQWVFDNIHHFGGDPENVTLMGQSAGAHIAMCTLLERVEKRSQRLAAEAAVLNTFGASSPSSYSSCSGFSVHSVGSEAGGLPQVATWDVRQIRTFIGISGPYNIENSIETFHRHGFDKSVVDRIMNYRISYFSPALRLFHYSEHARGIELLHDFPFAYLFHGTGDVTVNWKSSEQLANAMETCGLSVEAKYFEGKTHTDIIIEDPLSGSDDLLLGNIIDVIKARSPRYENGKTAFQFPDKFTPPRQYYPAPLVKLARYVNPFSTILQREERGYIHAYVHCLYQYSRRR